MRSPRDGSGARGPGVLALYAVVVVLVAAGLVWWSVVADPWAPTPVTWTYAVLLGGLFALSRLVAIEVDLRRDSARLTLTEVPLTIGLTVLPGPAIVLAFSVVVLVAGLLRRDAPPKLALNVAAYVTSVAVAVLVIDQLGPYLPGVPEWATVLIGVAVGYAMGTAIVTGAFVLLHGSRRSASAVRLMTNAYVISLVTCVAAIAALEVITRVTWGWLLVTVLGAALGVAYWAYYGLLRERRDFQMVNRVSLEVADIGRQDVGGDRLDDVVLAALESTREQVNAARVLVRRDDADGSGVLVVAGEPLPPEHARYLPPLPSSTDVPVEDTASTGVRRFKAVSSASAVRRALLSRGAAEVLVAPLRGAHDELGVIEVHDRLSRLRGFGAEDVRLVQTVASHLATALDNQRLLAQLTHDAYHDKLTGLRNRLGFRAGGSEQLGSDQRPAAVAVVDLGLLESVNDSLGHHWGDRIVEEAGIRFRDALPDGALVARLEGDTFAALLDDVDPAAATAAGERLRTVLGEPYLREPHADQDLALECSPVVGVALTQVEPTRDVGKLLQRADVALQAARRGGARVRLYAESMGQGADRRARLVRQFRGALHNGEIDVHVQPQIALAQQQVIGVEVLVRWQHPELGSLDPEEFVSVIENTGLIDALTTFVLDRALAQSRAWLDRDVRLSVAVNVSVRNLADPAFPDRVREALDRHEVPASLLVLELTESAVMSDPARALPVLRALHALGLRISVDDFGTGYSSLSYLRRLPVDEVKIDRSFVMGMESDLSDEAVVRAIIDLGRSLGLTVVAEGVEQDAARDKLREMGCDVVQGYLVSRPLPPERFDAWLDARTKRERDVHDEPVLRLAP